METATKLNPAEVLPNKKVVLMPVPREGQMIKDPKHKGYFMFDGSKQRFVLPIEVNRNALVQVLNEEERKFFEERLGLDLNFFKVKDNFWHTFEVIITKDDAFMQFGLTLDLSNPMDNLRWRVLKAQPIVAADWESRYDSGEYRYALRDAGYTEETKSRRAETMQKAFKHFNKMTTAAKMFEFLSIYWMDTNKAKRPPEGAEIEVYKGMIMDIIDSDASGFITVCEDSKAENKLMFMKALKHNIITKKSLTGDFETADGKYLGKTLDDAVTNLMSAELNPYLLKIQAQISASE